MVGDIFDRLSCSKVAHRYLVDTSFETYSMDDQTTQAAFNAIHHGNFKFIFGDKRVEEPVVQCVSVKLMTQNNGETSDRYRVVFSDTQNYVQTMLSTSMNDEVHADRLKKGVICKLLGYQANNVKGKR